MSRGPFEPLFNELPDSLPLFPLSGALLLPGGRLPLNIFEPRYLAMVQDAMMSGHRLIGMIQPKADGVYEIGCAGRIAEYSESDDGRVLISLAGTARFACHGTRLQEAGYLQGSVDFSRFQKDMMPDKAVINRPKLLEILQAYFDVKGFSADWEHIEACEDERLVTTLSMICPFVETEKQALLESDGLDSRTELLIAMLEMSVLSHGHEGQDDSGQGRSGNVAH